ncbi:phage distal tail protein domain-containing protein, partial [Oenococcus oeni]|uniref:phage distal tail protein domain-containing protein n=1 Tax=Oenococcus oeni TaxID=1247 RepID=UPI00214C5C23
MTNTYSVYNSSFIRTNSQLTDPTSNPYEVYIQFGDISSQSYQTFADFASFLAYPPYTLAYTTDAGTWYRKANLQSITKTEKGGSTIIAADRLNEAFILEFYTAWYQLQSEEYVSYSNDPNLGLYGKIYNTSIKRNATDDSVSFPDQTLINSSGIDLASIHDNRSATGTMMGSGSSEIQNALVSVKDNYGNIVGIQQQNTSPSPDQTVASPSDTIIIHDNSDGSST